MEPINSNGCSQHDPTPACLQYIQYCPNSKLSFIKDPNNEAMFNEKTNHLKNEVQDVAVPVVFRVLFVPSITVISDLTLCYL